jgi:hypothetical protein
MRLLKSIGAGFLMLFPTAIVVGMLLTIIVGGPVDIPSHGYM